MRYLIGLALSVFFVTLPAQARDVWVLGGFAESVTGVCERTRWVADPLIYNTGTAPAAVRIVHVSNGGPDNVIASLQPMTIVRAMQLGAGADAPLWMSHIELPAEVRIEGRIEYFGLNPCTLFPPDQSPLGKLATPVFTELSPAGEEQIHLGTDLGRQKSRVNVTIYNASNVAAHAVVSVHVPQCQNSIAVLREELVPADSVVQVPLGEVSCSSGVVWPSYVSVIVDQPSVSFVSTLSNETSPRVSMQISQP